MTYQCLRDLYFREVIEKMVREIVRFTSFTSFLLSSVFKFDLNVFLTQSFPPKLEDPFKELSEYSEKENSSIAAFLQSNRKREAALVSTAVISVLESNSSLNMSKNEKAKVSIR